MSRDICVKKFETILNDLNKSQAIEKSIYNYALDQSLKKGIENNIENKFFLRIYVNKIITLYNNLDQQSYIHNSDFYYKIMNNEIDIERIAFLNPQEINSSHWKKYLDKQTATDEFLYSRTVGIRTTEHKCGRCKAKDCTYYQLQVRCSDEPMTTFINCLNCGNKWSFN